ncbi:MAG: flagellar hook-associated protein FlgK, partial [Candidatus Firestonebacteria bacterium]|nr:flagellar hook-associated protein FlgK [Candidatus Firestonebacteria bacterium]
LGTGVKLEAVTRARDMLLEKQIHAETATQGRSDAAVSEFSQVENIVNEPSDLALGNALSSFWAGWQELSSNPENVSVRNSLVSTSQSLTQLINTKDKDLAALQQSEDESIRTQVAQINALASQIRDLNVQINQSLGVETTPNDLYDQRDKLLGQLSQLTNYEGHQMSNGLYDITIGGHTLVQDNTFVPLTVVNDPGNNNYAAITWSDDGSAAAVTSGKIQGWKDMRDTYIPAYRQALTDLATGLMTQVNALQSTGYALNAAAPAGINFFTGTGAGDMQVNAAIVADSTLVAAAQNASAPGDGSNALAIAQLQNSKTMSLGTQTFGGFYDNFVAQVGLDSKNHTNSNETQKALMSSLEAQRDSISSVNLDEEMTNMIKYQDGYQAAARVITTMDEMLDTIINRMGAGR